VYVLVYCTWTWKHEVIAFHELLRNQPRTHHPSPDAATDQVPGRWVWGAREADFDAALKTNRPLFDVAAVGPQPAPGACAAAGRAEGSDHQSEGRLPAAHVGWKVLQEHPRFQIPIGFGEEVVAVVAVADREEGHLPEDDSEDRQGQTVVEVDCILEVCFSHRAGPVEQEVFDR
jgi:hypothetical protein